MILPRVGAVEGAIWRNKTSFILVERNTAAQIEFKFLSVCPFVRSQGRRAYHGAQQSCNEPDSLCVRLSPSEHSSAVTDNHTRRQRVAGTATTRERRVVAG